jgi:hypothetical protein
VRQVAQPCSSESERSETRRINRGDWYALDDRRGTVDFMALRF